MVITLILNGDTTIFTLQESISKKVPNNKKDINFSDLLTEEMFWHIHCCINCEERDASHQNKQHSE